MGSVGKAQYHRARDGERRGERTIVRHTSLMCGGQDGNGDQGVKTAVRKDLPNSELRRHRGLPCAIRHLGPARAIDDYRRYSRAAFRRVHRCAIARPRIDQSRRHEECHRCRPDATRLGGLHRTSPRRVPCERATHSRRRPIARVLAKHHIGWCRRQTPSLHAHLDREPYEWGWARAANPSSGD